jgi:hypothetical protein
MRLGLKIPWRQPREGSSPFPSISYNQRVTSYLTEDCCWGKSPFTQILRNRLAKTSIKSSSFHLLFTSFIELLNFWRGRRDLRSIREQSLPQHQTHQNVAAWQSYGFAHSLSYFFLQLRKICVTLSQNYFKSHSHIFMSRLIQGINNPLRMPLHMKIAISKAYGNN